VVLPLFSQDEHYEYEDYRHVQVLTKVYSFAFAFPFPFPLLGGTPSLSTGGSCEVVSYSPDSNNLANFFLRELDDVEGRDASSESAHV
jgi:hypothetical protein